MAPVQTRSGDSVGFPPSQFDDYEVVRPLGAGGMGTVFLGRDRMLDRPVALKFIADGNADPLAREHVLPPAYRLREAPAPRSARSGDAVIAYQVFGDGPRDLVVMPGWVSNVELAWQEPGCADFLSRLAHRSR